VAPYLSSREPWNRFLAMLILFLLTSLAIWILFGLVSALIDRVRLKGFDHQMGALLGLIKGMALCLVITFFAVTLSEGSRQAVLDSHSGKFIARAIQRAAPAIPGDVREVLGKQIDQFERRLDPNAPPEDSLDDLDRQIRQIEQYLDKAEKSSQPAG
jgi:membrane protein required for colicin V production